MTGMTGTKDSVPAFWSLQLRLRKNISGRTCRAAKFTKNKNDQWNHAGGFSTSICAGLSFFEDAA